MPQPFSGILNFQIMKDDLQLISLFSGAGGLDLGFHKAGFTTKLATDNWEVSCNTLRYNGISSNVIQCDVSELELPKDLTNTDIDCLIGGPPCPPFSKSRFYLPDKPRGIKDEVGFNTINGFLKTLSILKPRSFVFENVHGFVYKPHQESLSLLLDQTQQLGYSVSWQVLNAADYGVPQTRERFFCVGLYKGLGDFEFPAPTHSRNNKLLKPWVTAGEAIGDIDYPMEEDVSKQAGSKHEALLKEIPEGENYLYFTSKRGHSNPIFEWRSRYWSFLLKLSRSRPSWTIQASFSNNMGPFHWNNRFLRILEIKRLQTFPDDFQLNGRFQDQWRLVGNAVPPQLSYSIANQLRNYLI